MTMKVITKTITNNDLDKYIQAIKEFDVLNT